MSESLASPADCCRPCPSPVVENIPGPQGPAGADGTNGVDGLPAYTTTTDSFTMPAELWTVTVPVVSSGWAVPGEVVVVGVEGGAAFGYFQVVSVPSAFTVTLLNLEDSGSGAYAGNSAPGTVFPSGITMAPGGVQGPAGSAGSSGAPVDATYLTQTPNSTLTNEQALSTLATGLMKVTTTTGVVSSVPLGISASNVAPVDSGGALTAGQVVQAVAGGLKSDTAANTRTLLGLGTIATQDANNVNITGGSISGVSISVPTPSGLVGAWLLYQNQRAAGTNGGSFGAGSWVDVPINTEVVDTGGNGSISGNTMTLAAGTYRARWRVSALQVDNFQTRLWNDSDGTVVALGSNARAAATDDGTAESQGEARFTLATSKDLKLQAFASAANLTTGFGAANAIGTTQVYQAIEFEKET